MLRRVVDQMTTKAVVPVCMNPGGDVGMTGQQGVGTRLETGTPCSGRSL